MPASTSSTASNVASEVGDQVSQAGGASTTSVPKSAVVSESTPSRSVVSTSVVSKSVVSRSVVSNSVVAVWDQVSQAAGASTSSVAGVADSSTTESHPGGVSGSSVPQST